MGSSSTGQPPAQQHFCFQVCFKCFVDALILLVLVCVVQIQIVLGDLTDVSAKTKTLLRSGFVFVGISVMSPQNLYTFII